MASTATIPWRGGGSFAVPDGSRVRIDKAGLDVSSPWNCLFMARVNRRRQGFSVCERGAVDQLLARFRGQQVERLSYRGAVLVRAHDAVRKVSTAAWQGRWHELIMQQSGPRPEARRDGEVFDAFRLTDSRDGLLVQAVSPRQVTFDEPFTVLKEIAGLGTLRMERPYAPERQIPAWAGVLGRAGEIWRKPFPRGKGAGRARPESLILATPTAVTELIPGPKDTSDSAAALAFLSDLNVVWAAK